MAKPPYNLYAHCKLTNMPIYPFYDVLGPSSFLSSNPTYTPLLFSFCPVHILLGLPHCPTPPLCFNPVPLNMHIASLYKWSHS